MSRGETREAEILAEPRFSGAVLAGVPGVPRLRWAGTLGATDIEVRGLDTVHVTVDEERGTVSIRTRDATIRLSRSPEPGEKGKP